MTTGSTAGGGSTVGAAAGGGSAIGATAGDGAVLGDGALGSGRSTGEATRRGAAASLPQAVQAAML